MAKKHSESQPPGAEQSDLVPAAPDAEAPEAPEAPPTQEPTWRTRLGNKILQAGEQLLQQPPAQPPSIGDIVIYASAGEKGVAGEPHAAIITGVDAGTVALHVFTRTAEHNVAAAEQGTGPGTWAWPAQG